MVKDMNWVVGVKKSNICENSPDHCQNVTTRREGFMPKVSFKFSCIFRGAKSMSFMDYGPGNVVLL